MVRAFGARFECPGRCGTELAETQRPVCPSESPHVKTDDRRDGEVPRELPFNSFWHAHPQADVRTHHGDTSTLASVRAVIDVRMSSPRAQP